jgi:hypothetical protein
MMGETLVKLPPGTLSTRGDGTQGSLPMSYLSPAEYIPKAQQAAKDAAAAREKEDTAPPVPSEPAAPACPPGAESCPIDISQIYRDPVSAGGGSTKPPAA